MSEETKVVNETKESESKEGLLAKFKNGVTSHKKEIVTVVAVISSGVTGYLLGVKSGRIDSDVTSESFEKVLEQVGDLIEED